MKQTADSCKHLLLLKRLSRAWLIFGLLMAFSLNARATITSTASGGLWNAATTWEGGVLPTASDDVVIATTGGAQVQVNVSSAVASLTINAGALLGFNDAGNSRTLTLNGNLVNNGSIVQGTGTTTGPTAHLTFSGMGRTWTGSGDISQVKTRVTVSTGGSLDISGVSTPMKFRPGTGSQPLNVNGTLITGTQVITNGGNTTMLVTFGASSSLITANTNGIWNGGIGTFAFNPSQLVFVSGSSVTFNGSTAQVTAGLTNTIANLTIDNSAGVTLSQATTVNNLSLLAGTLTTTPTNVLTIADGGVINGGTATAYVNGPLAQVYSGAGSKVFPIGVRPNFRQAAFEFVTISEATTLTITPQEPSVFGCVTPSGYAVSPLRSWTVASSSALANSGNLTVDGTGYPTATTMLSCGGGSAVALTTTSPSANNFTATIDLTAPASPQEIALGETCNSSPPTLTSATDGGVACNPVTVSWVANGTSTYKVYRKTGAEAYSLLASGLSNSPYIDATAVGNTTYTYAVAAVATCGGSSAESTKAEFAPYTTTAGKPGAPAQPTLTPACDSITVNWATVAGASSYNVYRKLSTDTAYGAPITTGQAGTSYADAAASDHTKTYIYAVAGFAVCEGFISPDSVGASPFFAPVITNSPAATRTNLLGSGANFAVAAIGTDRTYKWEVNKGSGFADAVEFDAVALTGDGTGTTNASFTTVLTTAEMAGYQYRCVVGGLCGSAVTSSPSALLPVIYIRSAASGSFAQGANFEMSPNGISDWVVANASPNSNSVTTIRSGHIMSNSNPNERQVRSLTIDAGGRLENGTGTTARRLAIFGSLTNNGTLLSTGGTIHYLYFRGSGSWVGSGDISTGVGAMQIWIDPGVALDASLLTTPIKMHATQGAPFLVYGTLNGGSLTISDNGNSGNTFLLDAGATLISANPNGLVGATATLNFVTAPSLSTAANYTFNGSSAQATTGLPTDVSNLTIANNSSAGVQLSQNVNVAGTLAVNAGATLDLNGKEVVLASAPALNGVLKMTVDKTAPNTFAGSKVSQTAGTLSYGGGLVVTATGLALDAADSIPLFNAAAYGGGFSSVSGPATPPGLTRNVSQLTGGTGGNITFCNNGPVTSAVAGLTTVSANQAGVQYSVTLTSGSKYAWTVPAGATITSGATGPNNNQIVVTFGSSGGNITVEETAASGCTGNAASLAVSVQSVVTPLPVTISGISGTALPYSGGAGTRFVLLSSPDVAAPLSTWARAATNLASPGSFTIPAVGSSARLFYRIQSE